ncbi:hypothetical protein, partial [Sphingorhabdus sp.]|uniref:hypothetical protein n=1 Tax=Sphingorhabdus sp. TaxID=1902408 RepID=UPI0037C829E8
YERHLLLTEPTLLHAKISWLTNAKPNRDFSHKKWTNLKGSGQSGNPGGSNRPKGKKRISGPPPQPSLPAVRQAILNALAQPPPTLCPHCRKFINNEKVPK